MKKVFCLILVLSSILLSFSSCKKELESDDGKAPEIIEVDVSSFSGAASRISNGEITVKISSPDAKSILGESVIVKTDGIDDMEICPGDDISVTIDYVEATSPYTVHAKHVIIIDDMTADKPVIYLYPEKETVCSVKLELDGHLTCTYPEHGENGWQNFTAYPDGTLIFPDGKEYYCLYWEGVSNTAPDLSRGFCVKGSETAEFLENILEEIGLTPREANEFIIYWLPILQENEYNLISFQSETYTDAAKLIINPSPDSLLRVFMAVKPLDSFVEIEPQEFDGFIREGFTVVEWGGGILD